MYTRIQMNIEPKDPDRWAGSLILSPNRASGVAALKPFFSKLGQPSELWEIGKTRNPPTSNSLCAGVTPTLYLSVSSAYAMRKSSDIEK